MSVKDEPRPISTAPRDATIIVLVDVDDTTQSSDTKGFAFWYDGDWMTTDAEGNPVRVDYEFSHWFSYNPPGLPQPKIKTKID